MQTLLARVYTTMEIMLEGHFAGHDTEARVEHTRITPSNFHAIKTKQVAFHLTSPRWLKRC